MNIRPSVGVTRDRVYRQRYTVNKQRNTCVHIHGTRVHDLYGRDERRSCELRVHTKSVLLEFIVFLYVKSLWASNVYGVGIFSTIKIVKMIRNFRSPPTTEIRYNYTRRYFVV
jgi:hypothetical protein